MVKIGDKVEAGFTFEVTRLERENGIDTVAGRVEVGDRKIWVNVPMSCIVDNEETLEERKCLHDRI